MSACTTCGVELTAFNRSLGSSTCAACSRGTSPAAQQKAIFALFARDPSMTEATLLGRSVGDSALTLIGGGLLAEGIYFGGTLVADVVFRQKGGPFMSMMAFAVGYGVAGALVTRSKHPIDAVRWRAFANTLAVVVAIGVVGSLALGFAATVLSLPIGLALGIVVVGATDGPRKESLRSQFRAYRGSP